jgi:hypothetical protein
MTFWKKAKQNAISVYKAGKKAHSNYQQASAQRMQESIKRDKLRLQSEQAKLKLEHVRAQRQQAQNKTKNMFGGL